MVATLSLHQGQRGLAALVDRAVRLDEMACVRIRQCSDSEIELYVTTPFSIVASRRAQGTVTGGDATVTASSIVAPLREENTTISLAMAGVWPGALPPARGFALVDVVPTTVARHLADQGIGLAQQFSGPLGPPRSLMDQDVITVTGGGHTARIPMRMIFTCTSLGLIPPIGAPLTIPRQLRVSVAGSWVRVDAPFGSVYRSTSLLAF